MQKKYEAKIGLYHNGKLVRTEQGYTNLSREELQKSAHKQYNDYAKKEYGHPLSFFKEDTFKIIKHKKR